MRDRVWIFAGLAVFVALLTTPFWYPLCRARAASQPPSLVLPANRKDCVAPVAVMRAEHMKMLVDWREDVVRRNDRSFVAYDGKVYTKSLTRTCLGCHSKQQFCDRCHTYSGVTGPYCWDCHNDPRTAEAAHASTNALPHRDQTGDLAQNMLPYLPKPFAEHETSRKAAHETAPDARRMP
jgi:hypothetical protein